MIERFISLLAPHLCFGCHKIGTILCNSCAGNIILESTNACVGCRKLAKDGICTVCGEQTGFSRCWLVGQRTAVLEAVINAYKFQRARDAYQALANLLDKRLPPLPAETVVVPVPTIASHIRGRGYDHCLLLAQAFANRRGLACTPLLLRAKNTVQRGASRAERLRQAQQAFVARQISDVSCPYLLIDDVITTNATLQSSARALRAAGATTIWAAVLAQQPLDG